MCEKLDAHGEVMFYARRYAVEVLDGVRFLEMRFAYLAMNFKKTTRY